MLHSVKHYGRDEYDLCLGKSVLLKIQSRNFIATSFEKVLEALVTGIKEHNFQKSSRILGKIYFSFSVLYLFHWEYSV